MPIVFVHGVNNRREDVDYDEREARTRGFLKEILAPRLGLDPRKVSIYFPYWGGNGVKFRWGQASLPNGSEAVETLRLHPLGPGSGDVELWVGETRFRYGPGAVNLGQVSRTKGFEEAVDLVWDTASAVAPKVAGCADVIEGYAASLAYLKSNPAPLWAMQATPLTNDAFVQKLLQEIVPFRTAKPGDARETLSLSDWFQSLNETLSRLGSAPSDTATALLVGLARKSTHEKASRFLGDIFVYLTNRGTALEPGAIVKVVLADLEAAHAAKKPGDEKLVVVGHSLGGVILYDIATYFKPDLMLDVFASVGSQVALFEEMSLYRASRDNLPPTPPADKLAKPAAMGKWLNVFDSNDVFSFLAETVFSGPTDYRFDTGYGLLQAHGGYFARPSFYKRLAVRLS